MAHSSQGFYVVEDNESQLWNHVILWFRILDGTVARPLGKVARVWYKSCGSLSGIYTNIFFSLKNWYKAVFLNLSICEIWSFLEKKGAMHQLLQFVSVLCRREQLSLTQGWQWLRECVCFEQKNVLGFQGKVLGWLLWGAAGGFPCIW